MSSKLNYHDRLATTGKLDEFQFILGKMYANNASKRKHQNIMDQGMDRFNKF